MTNIDEPQRRITTRTAMRVSAGAVAVLALFCAATGCGRGKVAASLPDAQDEFTRNPLAKSKSLQVNFYVDASVPLRGFLAAAKTGQKNYYSEVLNKAADILSESWDDTAVSFWRFGRSDPAQVDGLQRFKKPSEYTETKTYIDKAIRHQPRLATERQQLKVILTDLFQDDNAVGTLATELDNRYLKDESLAVGVLAMRSPYLGIIDDLPGMVPATAADSLPFYLLIAGRTPDVRLAMQRLTEELRVGPADHFKMIYAHRMVDRLTRPLVIAPADAKVGFLLDSGMVPGALDRNIPVLANVRHDVTVKLGEFPHPEIVALGPHVGSAAHKESIRVQATAFRRGQSGVADSKAAAALSFNLTEKTKLMSISRSSLTTDTIYLFQLDLLGERGEFGNVANWGLESEERDRVVHQKEFDRDEAGNRPGKTPNLRHFLNILSIKMYLSDIPLSRYYFYVEAK